jgi:UDP-N-acetylglucosamine 4,6-dehydratase/5-epimerase
MWTDKSIMITGGSGSLGCALARHILSQGPRRLVIFSRGEHRQEYLSQQLNLHGAENHSRSIRFFIGDVRDRKRLEMAMRDVEIVIHAAALKIVPKIEYNPFEAVETNIIGTENVIYSALTTGVGCVVFIGSDKQVNPINTYGATKLVGERLIVSANNYSAGRTKFCGVRYGNVAGSAGSIIPYWKSIVRCGGQITLTSFEMTRFSLTMPEAIKTIEMAIQEAQPREIVIPRLPSMRIEELARAMLFWARDNKYTPSPAYKIIGARPGEKMHEVLMTAEEWAAAEVRDDYFILNHERVRAVSAETIPYSSDTNSMWLNSKSLRELIDEC